MSKALIPEGSTITFNEDNEDHSSSLLSTEAHEYRGLWNNFFLVFVFATAVLICQTATVSSAKSISFPDSVFVTLSVSMQQEENFNEFMSWLATHETLSLNDSLQSAYQAVFSDLKQNNFPAYVDDLSHLDTILMELTTYETTALQNFFLSLSVEPVTIATRKVPGGGSCRVTCLFGSCSIECPTGTKPKCFCQSGNPHCGCEPYRN